jgi:hypothetical protein
MEKDTLDRAAQSIATPLWISDPRQPDCAIVVANEAFAHGRGVFRDQLCGQPCPYSDQIAQNSTFDPDRCASCKRADPTTSCAIHRQENGSPFLHLLSLQPLQISPNCALVVGCELPFKDSPTRIGVTDHAKKLTGMIHAEASAHRRVKGARPDLDQVYFNALLVRLDCAFTRLKNALIRANAKPYQYQKERFQRSSDLQKAAAPSRV